MDIIPVIDLKGGVVVHARGGVRDAYAPIRTPLAASAEPREVVAGLCAALPVRAIYVADLDAIERRGDHGMIIAELARDFPALAFWVDAGVTAEAAPAWLAAQSGHAVIGTESQRSADVSAIAREPRAILSLDFRGDDPLGPAALFEDAERWPSRVIVMTLGRVGGSTGPDFARVAAIVARAGSRSVYAAGGVRSGDDLRTLRDAGTAGALVASAIHDGRITRKDVDAILT